MGVLRVDPRLVVRAGPTSTDVGAPRAEAVTRVTSPLVKEWP